MNIDTQTPDQSTQARHTIGVLAPRLRGEFEEAEQSRLLVSDRWLADLLQYKGLYAQDTRERLQRSKRSQVFYRQTTAKVNTLTARLMDLLFPQRSKNWSLDPTPAPDLPANVVAQELKDDIAALAEQMLQQAMQAIQTQGVMPPEEALFGMQRKAEEAAFAQLNTEATRVRIAKERALRMERTIDDQLKESSAHGMRRASWQQSCRAVVKSACLYGMGVLKGPLVEKVRQNRFVQAENGWQEQEQGTRLRPYHEAVRLWDIFPDPDARHPGELRFVWQTHLLSDKDVLELARFPGFSGEHIRRHMQQHPDGDATLTTWEQQLRTMNSDNVGGVPLRNRYRVLERWGYLSGADLQTAGVDMGEQDLTDVYPANVWILGDNIIKAVVNPLEGVDIPYHFYPFQEDDTSFWPEGLASLLRGPQAGINAAVRAMQDNAAASAGPIFGINMAALAEGEDPLDIHANRVLLFDRAGLNLSQAFQAVNVPSCIEHNMAQSTFWQNAGDEIATPRFNAGDGNIAGAGKTASGLSMLMGASNILLKDHIKDFDECIVAPFIRAMFRWNMQWNEDENIKGDYEVVASGSQSLIAKEVRGQQIPALIGYLGIPEFAARLKPDKLLEVALEQTDLPAERILRADEEVREFEQRKAMEAAQAQAMALTEALMKQGMTQEQINQQILLLLAQLHAGQQGVETV